MAYTPELDLFTTRIVRRIAWAMSAPMTVALPLIIMWASLFLDAHEICRSCRAPVECENCPFNSKEDSECTTK